MKQFLLASVLTGAMSFPAFAQMSHDMSCADFTAMDADAQMEALGQMAGGGMAADTMAADSMAALTTWPQTTWQRMTWLPAT